jgi:tellurite resistance protein TehA-like permease
MRRLLITSLLLLLVAFPVMAQDTAEAAPPADAPGLTIFVVLLGLSAVVGAGGYLVWRERNRGEG